ncbi:MAG: BA14K family protein, partial [Mesorhizobium sp.]
NYNYYAPPPRRYYRTQRLSSAHVQWCYNRYRSYRAWDNTFQPYYGPRQQCYSPYR